MVRALAVLVCLRRPGAEATSGPELLPLERLKPFLFLSLLCHLSSFSSSLLYTSTHPCILGLWLLQRR